MRDLSENLQAYRERLERLDRRALFQEARALGLRLSPKSKPETLVERILAAKAQKLEAPAQGSPELVEAAGAEPEPPPDRAFCGGALL